MGGDAILTEYGRISSHYSAEKLENLCVDKHGVQTGPFGSQLHKKDYVDVGTPIITVEHLLENRISHADIPFVSDSDRERLGKYSLIQGDIVFSRVGSVDRRSLVRPEEDGWLFSGRCLRVRVDKAKIDPRYLSYFFGHEGFKNHIRSIAVGATMPSINTKILSDVRVFFPNLSEQKAIAHILGTLDDKIELNRRMNATLEGMAQALFKSWFMDFDPVIDKILAAGNPIPDPLKKRAEIRKALGDRRKPLPTAIAQCFPNRFIFSEEMGWVPEGWQVKSVAQVVNINPKVPLNKGFVAKYVDMKALPTSGYSITDVIDKEYSGGAKYKNGDVLLARITPCLENGKTGTVDFLEEGEVGFGSTEFIVLRGNELIKTPYIAALSRDNSFRQHCVTNMVGSSGRQRVQNSAFDSYFVCIPNKADIFSEYHRLCLVHFDMISVHKNQINSLAKIRDTLLPKLLSGQLRIPDAEKLMEETL